MEVKYTIFYISLLLLLLDCSRSVDSAQTELIPPPTSGSVCPGDVLTYICTACGPGSTLWKGTAFRCSSTQNEIILQHSRYNSPGGTTRYCNDRAIVGQSLRVENNDLYVSQLNVTISMDMNEKTIECAHTTTTGLSTIGIRTLSVFSVPSPPERVQLSKVRLLMEGDLIEFTFNWTNAIMNPFYYRITSSYCGTCPSNTTETTVTCDLLRTDDPPPCAFSVQSVSCGITGTASNQVEIVPKVPEAPTVISVIPHYSNDSKTLTSISITINGTASTSAIVDHLNIFISIDSAANPEVMNVQPICGNDICDYKVDVLSLCLGLVSDVLATVSASNLLGKGPPTNPLNISCTNRFLNVNYDSNTNILSCLFQDQPLTATNKSCSITYGPCNQEPTQSVHNFSTSDTIHLQLNISLSSNYCYHIFASNGSFTIFIDSEEKGGSEINKPGTSMTSIPIAIGCTCGILLILVIVAIITVLIIFFVCKRRTTKAKEPGQLKIDTFESAMDNIIRNLESHRIPKDCLKEYKIEKGCELKKFMDGKFKSGVTYYQLTEKENIYEDKSLIFKDTKGDLYPSIDAAKLQTDEVRLVGEEVQPPPKSKWTVFVQNKGSGARHLPEGSLLLYQMKEYPALQSTQPPLLPIYDSSRRFKFSKVKEKLTFKKFCEEELTCDSTSPVFLELGIVEEGEIDSTHYVILKRKKGPQLFAGSAAHIKEWKKQNEAESVWQIFVRVAGEGSLMLDLDTSVLHQTVITHSFYIWTVDEDDVRLSKFVENYVRSFENGKAFYKFSEEADKDHLHYYRGVIIIDKNSLENTECQAEVCIRSYSEISNHCGFLQEKLSNQVVFIECTSFGARNLKKGQKILYKKSQN